MLFLIPGFTICMFSKEWVKQHFPNFKKQEVINTPLAPRLKHVLIVFKLNMFCKTPVHINVKHVSRKSEIIIFLSNIVIFILQIESEKDYLVLK